MARIVGACAPSARVAVFLVESAPVTPELAAYCEQQLTRVRESGALAVFEAAAPELRDALPRVLAASDFVCRSAARRDASGPRQMADRRGARWTRVLARGEMARRLRPAVAGQPDLAGFMAALRRQRRTRDGAHRLARPRGLGAARRNAGGHQRVCRRRHRGGGGIRQPRSGAHVRRAAQRRRASAQPFIVLGMGKLGGGELNFSSDIDLIFVFPEKGTTAGAPLHRQRGLLHAARDGW